MGGLARLQGSGTCRSAGAAPMRWAPAACPVVRQGRRPAGGINSVHLPVLVNRRSWSLARPGHLPDLVGSARLRSARQAIAVLDCRCGPDGRREFRVNAQRCVCPRDNCHEGRQRHESHKGVPANARCEIEPEQEHLHALCGFLTFVQNATREAARAAPTFVRSVAPSPGRPWDCQRTKQANPTLIVFGHQILRTTRPRPARCSQPGHSPRMMLPAMPFQADGEGRLQPLLERTRPRTTRR
jgi:hypothetical protein